VDVWWSGGVVEWSGGVVDAHANGICVRTCLVPFSVGGPMAPGCAAVPHPADAMRIVEMAMWKQTACCACMNSMHICACCCFRWIAARSCCALLALPMTDSPDVGAMSCSLGVCALQNGSCGTVSAHHDGHVWLLSDAVRCGLAAAAGSEDPVVDGSTVGSLQPSDAVAADVDVTTLSWLV
jgi:hypothetical protein